jgi:uncharacterized protein YkwD
LGDATKVQEYVNQVDRRLADISGMAPDTVLDRRHHTSSGTSGLSHRSAILRSIALGASLAAGTFFAAAPSGNVVALEQGISVSAVLSSGLQRADRLDPPPPRHPVVVNDVQAVLTLVNAERAARGIAPVSLHGQLTQAAQAHAADQFYRDCVTQLSHTGTDGSNPGTRIARTGLSVRSWAENIACGQRTPAEVMTAWMNSSGHRRNILNSGLTHIGISVSRDSDGRLYWVQVFASPR